MAGCQDGYPIAATACDRYCDLGLVPGCGEYGPTECVVICESHWNSTRCSNELDDWVSCLKRHHYRLVCDYTFPSLKDGCETEESAWYACAVAYAERVRKDVQ